MAGRKITIEFLGNSRDLQRDLAQLEGKTSKFGGVMRSIGKGAALGLAGATAGAIAWGKESADSLARIERINTQTATVIESTGAAAGVTAGHVERLAGRLENLTATEAESTQEGANLLLTFTNIRNEAGKGNAIFDRTVRTMTDMGRALGQDAKSSALQLGKALNDPIKGVSALQRVGVSFTESQKDQIKALVESGDTMKAQKVILGELDRQFGGSAKAFAETTEGKVELAKHAFGTLGETIFAGVMPVMGDLATSATKLLTKLNEFVPVIQQNLGPAFERIKAVISGFFGGSGGEATVWAADIKATFTDLVSIIRSLWDRFGSTILRYTKTTFANIKQVVGGALKIVSGIFKTVSALLQGDWAGAWDGIKKIASGAKDILVGIVKQLWNFVRTAFTVGGKVLKSVFSAAWDGLKSLASRGVDAIVGFVKGMPGRLSSAAAGAFDGVKNAFRDAVNWIIDKWNGLSFSLPSVDTKIPGVGKVGGFTVGTPDIPRLAAGGIVPATPGGRLALIGEGGRDEAVIPLSSARGRNALGGGGITINVSGALDPVATARQIEQLLVNYTRTTGRALAFER